ncbi:MAG: GDP-mannose-dependent alpha-(1-6)-phosphatidylinositol monomannoside mannosyltransferase [Syntrophorhabdus sp. PtaB.Bin006]|nr:MAG: GDP-mannose-dependent alpha-(1-6)-phosphatidylinositol monomannoside mannosyltransferase [Syntrophorhabdus sp. PtaB.Bin006]
MPPPKRTTATTMMKIKVGYVRDSCGLYGAERVILAVARYLDRNRFDLTLFALSGNDSKSCDLADEARRLGVQVVDIPVKGRIDISAAMRLRRLLKDGQFDIIHGHDFKANFYVLLSSLRTKLIRIATAHGFTEESFRIKAYLAFDQKVFYRYLNKIVAVSWPLRGLLVSRGVPEEKILVIENGIDLDFIDSESILRAQKKKESRLSEMGEKLVFCVIGRLNPDKGQQFFMEAFANMIRDYPRIRGAIVGAGPEREHLSDLIDHYGLREHVCLCGEQKNMDKVYKLADCVVIPSLREGLPYVLLEAAAFGIPVIASNVGGIPAIIKHNESGILVAPGQPQELESAMRTFVDSRESAYAMAKRAQQTVRHGYSAQAMVRQLEKIYDQLRSEHILAGLHEVL